MLKKNVVRILDERDWSLRKLACNMSIKKKRLVRGLEQGASRELVDRISRALGVAPLSLTRSQEPLNFEVSDDGTLIYS